jgi:hypothetical protein
MTIAENNLEFVTTNTLTAYDTDIFLSLGAIVSVMDGDVCYCYTDRSAVISSGGEMVAVANGFVPARYGVCEW